MMVYISSVAICVLAPASLIVTLRRGTAFSKSLVFSLSILAFALTLIIVPPPPPYDEFLVVELFIIWPEMYLACSNDIKWALPIYLIFILMSPLIFLGGINRIVFDMWLVGTPVLVATAVSSNIKGKTKYILAGACALIGCMVLSEAPSVDPLYSNIFLVSLIVGIWWAIGIVVILLHYSITRRKVASATIDFTVRKGFQFEVKRKIVHVALVIFLAVIPFGPILARFLNSIGFPNYPDIVASELFLRFGIHAFTVATLFVDTIRLALPEKTVPFKQFINSVIREREQYRYLGATHLLVAASFLVQYMHLYGIITLILIVAFGDASGALIGTKWGKHRVMSRSIEGTIAEVVVSFIIANFLLGVYLAILTTVAVFLADWIGDLVDISDNLLIPLFVSIPVISFGI